ncbi:transcriptional regulator, TetR family [Saccharopolyspora kobensis]|uniref:Transcriptional regulator, TetR family n=1 Tax=Saccharopolyspora kobensis TaxID=146035 RepID=A0A1H6EM04_9PSEU|nr:TetR/AcrR family transcriptional regulator [Saccharopolyspora kobensis]SEG98056.1 transcriptional regulator, TetR family [Saccharopolyspora kobensis]SFE96142.1 transcriptional regulator, TetR family [Saccharopolyspora kobensis]
MGRPPRHDADRLLDAAVSLAAESGPRGVTMAAVARAAGAPSGSVYHRFPDRAALLSALWLRTVTRFQDGFFAVVEAPPLEAAVATARHVIEWCRENPAEAKVLLAGPDAYGRADWPDAAREQLAKANAQVDEALTGLAERLGRSGMAGRSRVFLAVVDLPCAVVRRYLGRGEAVPALEVGTVTDAVRDLLAG